MNKPGITIVSQQKGFTLLELMVALAISITVMSGVVQMVVVSKNNFVTGRELATSQENGRYAMKFMTDEIRMAGFTGCNSNPASVLVANSIIGSVDSWYLGYPGLQGYEHEAGVASFPDEFKDEVAANTDVLVVRRSEATGLRLASHTPGIATITLNDNHSISLGQPMVIAAPDCLQVGVFQISASTANTMVHDIGTAVPGNCVPGLINAFDCATNPLDAQALAYRPGSSVNILRSEAFYIGPSTTDNSVPALYRERMIINAAELSTAEEELVKGIENMQILYGVDSDADGIANRYAKATDAAPDWHKVISIRLNLRIRSLLPVYTEAVAFGMFEGVVGTNGADRFMRQDVSTTINIRNY